MYVVPESGVGGNLINTESKPKPKVKEFMPVKSVKIGAYDIPIVAVDDYIQFGDSEALGLYTSDVLRITISKKVTGQKLAHVVCHEICHAMADYHHIPVPDDREAMEVVNDSLATAMYAFIKDNPELVKWIQKNK